MRHKNCFYHWEFIFYFEYLALKCKTCFNFQFVQFDKTNATFSMHYLPQGNCRASRHLAAVFAVLWRWPGRRSLHRLIADFVASLSFSSCFAFCSILFVTSSHKIFTFKKEICACDSQTIF